VTASLDRLVRLHSMEPPRILDKVFWKTTPTTVCWNDVDTNAHRKPCETEGGEDRDEVWGELEETSMTEVGRPIKRRRM
jgi:hypothetical protein